MRNATTVELAREFHYRRLGPVRLRAIAIMALEESNDPSAYAGRAEGCGRHAGGGKGRDASEPRLQDEEEGGALPGCPRLRGDRDPARGQRGPRAAQHDPPR